MGFERLVVVVAWLQLHQVAGRSVANFTVGRGGVRGHVFSCG